MKKEIKPADVYKKISKNVREYAPSTIHQENIRQEKPFDFPSQTDYSYTVEALSNDLFPPWPSEAEINKFNDEQLSLINSDTKNLFTDPSNNLIIFPLSLRIISNSNVEWLRPSEFITQQKIKNKLLNNEKTQEDQPEIQYKINMFRCSSLTKIRRRNSIDVIANTNVFTKTYLDSTERKINTKVEKELKEVKFTIINNDKPSNIKLNTNYSKYTKWLGSLFQAVIDNRINGTSFYKNIYPQKDGVPIYNPNGRYWIKLFHMGAFRKIEIDDLIPCDGVNYKPYLPQTVNDFELWPLLFSKAIMKLYSYKYRNDNYEYEEIGDCSPIFALTGYFAYEVRKDLIFDVANVLKGILSDDNYSNHALVLLSYKISEENKKHKETFSFKNFDRKPMKNRLAFSTCQKLPPLRYKNDKGILATLSYNSEIYLKRPTTSVSLPSERCCIIEGIFSDTVYSIIELFQSGKFNMQRLFPFYFADLKLSSKKKYKQMNTEEKKDYLARLKDLRIRQVNEKNKRKFELMADGENVDMIKFTNECFDGEKKLYQVKTKYTDEQIEMAKYCVLNNVKYPTVEFFKGTFLKKIFKDEETGEINFWTERFYKRKILEADKGNQQPQPNEENKEPEVQKEIKLPIKREEGSWLDFDTFKTTFSNFTLLVNKEKFENTLFIDNIWYNSDKDLYEEKDSSKIIKVIPSNISGDTSVYLLFEPNCERNHKSVSSGLPPPQTSRPMSNKFDDINYSISFQIYYVSKDKQIERGDKVDINKLFSSYHLTIPKKFLEQNYECLMIIKGTTTPFGYYLSLFSHSSKLQSYSYGDFLAEYRSFTQKKISYSYPSLPQNKYFVLGRVRLTYHEDANHKKDQSPEEVDRRVKFFSNLSGFDNVSFKEHVSVFLINSETGKTKEIFCNQVLSIDFSICSEYLIEISIRPPYSSEGGAFEYNVLCDNKSLLIEKIDLIQPYNVNEEFIPNKHRVVFKELIYPTDFCVSSFDISLIKIQLKEDHPEAKEENQKDEEEKNSSQLSQQEIIKPENVKMKVTVKHDGKVLLEKEFENETVIRNLIMKGKQNSKNSNGESIPYEIICKLSSSDDYPYLSSVTDYKKDYKWNISVFTSDPILIIRDTRKEDEEAAVIASWEKNQPGRSALASLSRRKYLVLQKYNNGEELTNEESQLIGVRKEIIESTSDMILTNIPPREMSSGNLKPRKSLFDIHHKLPTIESYRSIFVRNFFSYANGDRVLTRGRQSSSPVAVTEAQREEERRMINERYEGFYKNLNQRSGLNDFRDQIAKSKNEYLMKRLKLRTRNNEELRAGRKFAIDQIAKISSTRQKIDDIVDNIENNNVNNNNFSSIYSEFKSVNEMKSNPEFSKKIESIKMSLSRIFVDIIERCLKAKPNPNLKKTLQSFLSIINEGVLEMPSDTKGNIEQVINKIK